MLVFLVHYHEIDRSVWTAGGGGLRRIVPRAPASLYTNAYSPAAPIPPPLFKPCRWQRRTSDTLSSGRPCAPRSRRGSRRPRQLEYGASTGAVGGAGPPAVSAVGGGEGGTREGGELEWRRRHFIDFPSVWADSHSQTRHHTRRPSTSLPVRHPPWVARRVSGRLSLHTGAR